MEKENRLEQLNKIPYQLQQMYKLIILCIGVFSVVYIFLSCVDLGVNRIGLFVFDIMICLLFQMIIKSKRRVFIALGMFAGFLLLFYRKIAISAVLVINEIIITIREPYQLDIDTFTIPSFENVTGNKTFLILLFSCMICLIMGYFIIINLQSVPHIILILLPICIFISSDVMPGITALGLASSFLIAVIVLKHKVYIHKFYNAAAALSAGAVFFVILLFILLVLPEASYKRVALFETFRYKIEDMFLWLGPSEMGRGSFGGGVGGGTLGEFGEVGYTERTMLIYTAPATGKTHYLRAYYGHAYYNNRWNALDRKNDSGLYNMLKSYNMAEENITSSIRKYVEDDARLMELLEGTAEKYGDNVHLIEYEVEYKDAARGYEYIPYGSLTNFRASGDKYRGSMYAANIVDYMKYKNVIENYGKRGSIQSEEFDTFWSGEMMYRNYARNVYTRIPENILNEAKDEISRLNIVTDSDKEKFIEDVRNYFNNNFEYTLRPGKTPKEKDTIEYFLYENKKGYCVYFASTATLLFRAAGIPARYVEGYAVSDEDLRSGQLSDQIAGQQSYTVEVKDNSAHAWVEVYKDGYGWVPVEVTPGRSVSDIGSYTPDILPEDETNSNIWDQPGQEPEEDESQQIGGDLPDAIKNGDDPEQESSNDQILKVIGYIGIILAVIILGTGSIIGVQYANNKRKRKRLFSRKKHYNTNKQVLYIYKYLEDVCKFLSLERLPFIEYEEYTNYLKAQNELFQECDIESIMRIVLKGRFGKDPVSEEEAEFVTREVQKLRKEIIRKAERKDRLKFIYWNQL